MLANQFKYRPEIDGLRAVAIILVVLFHAFPKSDLLKGGFIGVDVFFVISGFLITSIIKHGIEDNTFSFLRFYLNRVRRIFPALITLLIFLALFSWVGLFAEELKQFGLHLIGATTFTSNFILNGQSGYFDTESFSKPLLHLWSLSIEEQFYLFWPLLIWLLLRLKATFSLPIIFLFSLIAQNFEQEVNSTAAFYLPQFRCWELLVGAMLVFLIDKLKRHDSNQSRYALEGMPAVGLLLILLGSLFVCRENSSNFRMLLFPILGASLIILSTPNSWISKRILANKVMVTLGLISYPLYLWHWPIFSLDKIIFNSTASLSRQSILILISLILAYLTYSLIEKPLRKSGEGKIKYFILIFLMIFLGFFGWRCFERSGYPHRSGAFIVNKIGDTGYDAFSDHLEKSYKNCIPSELNNWVARYKNKPRCFQSQVGTHRDIVLLGDSHAEHLFPGLASEFSDKNVIYLMNSDLPFFTVDHYAKIFQWIANDENISTVIFSMYWAKRLPGLKLDDFELKFDQTISFLKKSGKRVIILDDVPDFSFDAKECKYKRLNGRVKCSEKRHFLEEVDEYYPYLNEISQRTGVTVVNLSHLFCSGDECNMTAGNALLYRDVNHLNLQGSLFVGRALKTEHAIP